MSTFKGLVAEFPQIRIDYFRHQLEHKPPLACFLSHVHSDHLSGLESIRPPFVYCSAATREILLRLEKHCHRLNFAKGVLERRSVTYDRSMRRLAKPLPLDTPTMIELAPGNSLRVTLIDANHCIGAVMFLIEGGGNAVLYTGDIRAETWWLNSLVQNPVLLPYTLGLRQLDCVYLDTTFATKREPYRSFPSKAEGICELLEQLSHYSDDTVFYFHSWTFGYEKVWVALSTFLNSRIHLDDYRACLYGSLSTLDSSQLREIGLRVPADNKFARESGLEIREAPALCGFKNGNHIQPGCLTSKENVRVHSCERGAGCQTMDHDTDSKIVHIIPIITRTNGAEIAELGAGGGNGDLDQEEKIAMSDLVDTGTLLDVDAASSDTEELSLKFREILKEAINNGNSKLNLDIGLHSEGQGEPSLETLISVLSAHAPRNQNRISPQSRTIRFPYSRHSSYSELCKLIEALRPIDVVPCTVDEDNWTPVVSMRNLFGELCSGDLFRHDAEMTLLYEEKLLKRKREEWDQEDTEEDTQVTSEALIAIPAASKRIRIEETSTKHISTEYLEGSRGLNPQRMSTLPSAMGLAADVCTVSNISVMESNNLLPPCIRPNSSSLLLSLAPTFSAGGGLAVTPRFDRAKEHTRFNNRQLAYHAAIGTYLTWSDYGGLVSTRSKADRDEQDL
ncbi:beta-lactamase-like protein [Pyrenochaeta sp. MPI-SDFR-AT-0127]|nr:beta-lactamase-like protein [Pyrenochaeta sp. MPI-SDFR-AT-0127]